MLRRWCSGILRDDCKVALQASDEHNREQEIITEETALRNCLAILKGVGCFYSIWLYLQTDYVMTD